MQKKLYRTRVALVGVLILLIITLFFFLSNTKPEIHSDSEIIQILKTNPDVLDYMDKNKNFVITNKTILTKQSILEGQNATYFKEIYQNLSLEDNRYIKVDLVDTRTNYGLITLIDIKEKVAVKVFGLILVGTQVQTK